MEAYLPLRRQGRARPALSVSRLCVLSHAVTIFSALRRNRLVVAYSCNQTGACQHWSNCMGSGFQKHCIVVSLVLTPLADQRYVAMNSDPGFAVI